MDHFRTTRSPTSVKPNSHKQSFKEGSEVSIGDQLNEIDAQSEEDGITEAAQCHYDQDLNSFSKFDEETPEIEGLKSQTGINSIGRLRKGIRSATSKKSSQGGIGASGGVEAIDIKGQNLFMDMKGDKLSVLMNKRQSPTSQPDSGEDVGLRPFKGARNTTLGNNNQGEGSQIGPKMGDSQLIGGDNSKVQIQNKGGMSQSEFQQREPTHSQEHSNLSSVIHNSGRKLDYQDIDFDENGLSAKLYGDNKPENQDLNPVFDSPDLHASDIHDRGVTKFESQILLEQQQKNKNKTSLTTLSNNQRVVEEVEAIPTTNTLTEEDIKNSSNLNKGNGYFDVQENEEEQENSSQYSRLDKIDVNSQANKFDLPSMRGELSSNPDSLLNPTPPKDIDNLSDLKFQDAFGEGGSQVTLKNSQLTSNDVEFSEDGKPTLKTFVENPQMDMDWLISELIEQGNTDEVIEADTPEKPVLDLSHAISEELGFNEEMKTCRIEFLSDAVTDLILGDLIDELQAESFWDKRILLDDDMEGHIMGGGEGSEAETIYGIRTNYNAVNEYCNLLVKFIFDNFGEVVLKRINRTEKFDSSTELRLLRERDELEEDEEAKNHWIIFQEELEAGQEVEVPHPESELVLPLRIFQVLENEILVSL